MRTLGVDVSHYQGDVNWLAVAKSDVGFAFAKASEGAGVDDHFQKSWTGIQEAGLFRGAYHFGHPGGDPETQAVHFASVVGALGFRDLPPALDLEVSDGHPADKVLEWARAFLASPNCCSVDGSSSTPASSGAIGWRIPRTRSSVSAPCGLRAIDRKRGSSFPLAGSVGRSGNTRTVR